MKIPPTKAKKYGCHSGLKYLPKTTPKGDDSANNAVIMYAEGFAFFANKKAPKTKEIGILCTTIPKRYGLAILVSLANGIPSIKA